MTRNSHCYALPPSGKKLILVYNRPAWFLPDDTSYRNTFKRCSYDACVLTDDRTAVQHADAVVVHVCRMGEPRPPPRRSPRQIWVAFSLESPVHYQGYHSSPSWRSVFNWTQTYRTDSEIFSPYGSLVVRSTPSLKNHTEIVRRKRRAVAWSVSNCRTQSRREQYVQELQKYIDVDIFGPCQTLRCPPGNPRDGCLGLLNTTYYFYLSFENSLCRDYVTEKFFKVFDNINVIPVVRGGTDYEQYFPPNTFINTADFESPQHLATHLKTLMTDTKRYGEMLRTKDNFLLKSARPGGDGMCDLCRRLHVPDIPEHVYQDFMDWTSTNMCWQPKDV